MEDLALERCPSRWDVVDAAVLTCIAEFVPTHLVELVDRHGVGVGGGLVPVEGLQDGNQGRFVEFEVLLEGCWQANLNNKVVSKTCMESTPKNAPYCFVPSRRKYVGLGF